jgi:hypothetical protein
VRTIRIYLQTLLLTFTLVMLFHFIYDNTISKLVTRDALQIQLFLTYGYIFLFLVFRFMGNWGKFNKIYWYKLTNNDEDVKIIYNVFSYVFLFVGILNILIVFTMSEENWVNYKVYSYLLMYPLTSIVCGLSIKKKIKSRNPLN